ncbi:MAG: prepilin peptidase [Novosphingobium sp.]
MAGGTLAYGLLAGLAIALLTAAWTDIRSRRIDNRLTLAVALAAPLFWWATDLPLWPEAMFRVGFAGLMFLLLAALFAMRVMGGGDVKLLTALALWLPWLSFLKLVVTMALLGGLLTVVLIAVRLGRRGTRDAAIPYGVAIAGGGLWVLATTYPAPPGLLG